MFFPREVPNSPLTCSSFPAVLGYGPSSPLSSEACRVRAPPESLNMASFSNKLSLLEMGEAIVALKKEEKNEERNQCQQNPSLHCHGGIEPAFKVVFRCI